MSDIDTKRTLPPSWALQPGDRHRTCSSLQDQPQRNHRLMMFAARSWQPQQGLKKLFGGRQLPVLVARCIQEAPLTKTSQINLADKVPA
jgi:hypothetical protein